MNIVINEYQDNVSANKLVTELYKHYSRKLFAYTKKNYNISEDDIWTLVYKTIYRIAEVHDRYTFDSPQKQSAFVFKTHINYLRNYFRDNKSFEAKNLEVELNDRHIQDKAETATKENLHLRLLQQHLEKLEAWERILLLMRGQDMPYSEIVKYVNKPEKQLKVYYARLKKQLLLNLNQELQSLNDQHDEKK
jgi:RNA polymerase sigma factor (sigma-70 family)